MEQGYADAFSGIVPTLSYRGTQNSKPNIMAEGPERQHLLGPRKIKANSFLGGAVRRLFVAAMGFVWGLFLAWLSLYVFSHANWAGTTASVSGCSDMEHCGPRSQTLFVLFVMLFGPAFAFAGLNAVAYRRWSTPGSALVFFMGSVLIVLFYASLYAVPRFGGILK
jgi:hypothetical protein